MLRFDWLSHLKNRSPRRRRKTGLKAIRNTAELLQIRTLLSGAPIASMAMGDGHGDIDHGGQDCRCQNDDHAQHVHPAAMALISADQATNTITVSGDWSDPAVWQNGILPADGARIIIPQGMTLTVDSVIPQEFKTIGIHGTLNFKTDVDTELRVDTVISAPHGRFEMGTAANPVAANVTARVVFVDDGIIDTNWDPEQLSRGAILQGKTEIHGAETTHQVSLAAHPAVGATTLQLNSVPVGWNAGDEIIITGTQGSTSEEVRTIQSIDGTTVTLNQALALDHIPPLASLNVYVANTTRNVELTSENPATAHRGHMMFMHTNDVSVRNAAFTDLGRTDKKIPLDDFTFEFPEDAVGNRTSAGVVFTITPGARTNVRGRYPVHFHRGGTDPNSTRGVVDGSVVIGSPGYGFVNHSSNVDLTKNVSYDIHGSAFYTEAGDEIGSIADNIAIRTVNPDFRLEENGEISVDLRADQQDFGVDGDAFWLSGHLVSMTGNVASGASGHGIIIWSDGLVEADRGRTTIKTSDIENGHLITGRDTIPTWWAPLAEISNNESSNATVGFRTRYIHSSIYLGDVGSPFHEPPDWAYIDTLSPTIDGLTVWGSRDGALLNYSERLTLRNAHLIGIGDPYVRQDGTTDLGVGIDMYNEVSRGPGVVDNVTVEGFNMGILAPLHGEWQMSNIQLRNTTDLHVEQATIESRTLDMTNITFGELSGTAVADNEGLRRNVVMKADGSGNQPFWFLLSDSVSLNGQGLYFDEQAASHVPLTAELHEESPVPTEFIGQTNQQLLDTYGTSFGGEITPTDAQAVLWLTGGVVGSLAEPGQASPPLYEMRAADTIDVVSLGSLTNFDPSQLPTGMPGDHEGEDIDPADDEDFSNLMQLIGELRELSEADLQNRVETLEPDGEGVADLLEVLSEIRELDDDELSEELGQLENSERRELTEILQGLGLGDGPADDDGNEPEEENGDEPGAEDEDGGSDEEGTDDDSATDDEDSDSGDAELGQLISELRALSDSELQTRVEVFEVDAQDASVLLEELRMIRELEEEQLEIELVELEPIERAELAEVLLGLGLGDSGDEEDGDKDDIDQEDHDDEETDGDDGLDDHDYDGDGHDHGGDSDDAGEGTSGFHGFEDIPIHDPSSVVRDGNMLIVYGSGVNGAGLVSFIYDLESSEIREGDGVFNSSDDKPDWIGDIQQWNPTGEFDAPAAPDANTLYYTVFDESDVGIQDAIGLATRDDDGTWTDQGIVVRSVGEGDHPRAMDPSILRDEDGHSWMIFGSHAGGIYSVELDPITGKLKDDPENVLIDPETPENMARFTLLASRGQESEENAVEAAYVTRHGDEYFLFLNFGICCNGVDSTYNIRVGRSNSPTGPFTDRNGADLTAGGGSLVLDSQGEVLGNPDYIGPGHAGIFTLDDQDYFTFHFYDGSQEGEARFAARQLDWDEQGWPVISYEEPGEEDDEPGEDGDEMSDAVTVALPAGDSDVTIEDGFLIAVQGDDVVSKTSLNGVSTLTLTGTSNAEAIILDLRNGTELNLESISILAGDGDDTVTFLGAGSAATVMIAGEGGNDLLIGSSGDEEIIGGGGNDTMIGGAGRDKLSGGAGDDVLIGNGGHDTLDGGEGDDFARGDSGNDDITAGSGADVLLGRAGDDTLRFTAGIDSADGGAGNNTMLEDSTSSDAAPEVGGTDVEINISDSGESVSVTLQNGSLVVSQSGAVQRRIMLDATEILTITGSAGDDEISIDFSRPGAIQLTSLTINGQAGSDVISIEGLAATLADSVLASGGLGDDVITFNRDIRQDVAVDGGVGHDSITTAQGRDMIRGGDGNDFIDGGAQRDFIRGDRGHDLIFGRGGSDRIYGGSGFDTINGNGGNDLILGNSGDDFLKGASGNDRILGHGGDDVLRGDAGDDILLAGDGQDVLLGNAGNDGLSAGAGNDLLFGHKGNDSLIGGDGDDTCSGHNGDDIVMGQGGDDVVIGHGGDDILSGGDGADEVMGSESEIDEDFTFLADWIDTV